MPERMTRLYRPFNRYFRSRRMRRFCDSFGLTSDSEVLDVGGTPSIWRDSPITPLLTLVNLRAPRTTLPRGIRFVRADGRRLPFGDKSFDVVFCNSVIEHLGTKEAQHELAQEICRVGTTYYVQTPCRSFPVEPHLMTPILHFMPKPWQARLMRNFSVRGLLNRPSRERCTDWVEAIRLLDGTELAEMFPHGRIEKERFLGLTKSLLVVPSPKGVSTEARTAVSEPAAASPHGRQRRSLGDAKRVS
jgi:SAM-dependent methyltransferase